MYYFFNPFQCEELEKSKSEMENSPENDSPPGPGAADIGNYTLKSDPQYRVAKDKRTTHKKKRLQILKVEKKVRKVFQSKNERSWGNNKLRK